jgi:hypothetical protein
MSHPYPPAQPTAHRRTTPPPAHSAGAHLPLVPAAGLGIEVHGMGIASAWICAIRNADVDAANHPGVQVSATLGLSLASSTS